MRVQLLAGLLAGVSTLYAGEIAGPVPGFVFDRAARTLRPIIGMAGSAYLGASIDAASDTAAVSPDGSMALVSRGGAVMLLRLNTGDIFALADSMADASRFAWSSDGISAVAWSRAGRAIQVLRDLRTAPAAGGLIDVSSIEGDLRSLAFNGEYAAVGVAGAVFLAGDSGVSRLADAVAPIDIEMARDDLYVADRGRILEIRDFATTASTLLFTEYEDAVGIQISPDGRRLLAAGARSVDAFDLATRSRLSHLDLDFAPSRMEAAGRLALLNFGSPNEPLYVLDEDFNVSFVPAGREQ